MLFLTCEQIEETEGTQRYSVVNRTILDVQEKKVSFSINKSKNLLNFSIFQGKYTFSELPYLIFGSLALLAAVATYFIAETRGIPLPDTIESVEKKDGKLVQEEQQREANDTKLQLAIFRLERLESFFEKYFYLKLIQQTPISFITRF